MLVRIVKLSINPQNTDSFLANFEANKISIRAFEGCNFLELYRDQNNTDLFFTYSHWKSEKDLDNYRNSELFNGIWAKTKKMFNGKPEAWSVDKLARLD